jgi:hypothetical protein
MEDDALRQIEVLNVLVQEYYGGNLDGHRLNELLQKITGNLYYLETVRSHQHNLFETMVHNLVKKGNSVARATNEAHVEYPLMYQLRRVMDSGYRIADAIRTNISYLKSEKSNQN